MPTKIRAQMEEQVEEIDRLNLQLCEANDRAAKFQAQLVEQEKTRRRVRDSIREKEEALEERERILDVQVQQNKDEENRITRGWRELENRMEELQDKQQLINLRHPSK